MEADGQSGEALPAEQDELEEQPTFHPRHPTRHLSAPSPHLLKVRGPDARSARERAFQHFHQQPDAEMQAGDQAVQRGQNANV